MIHTMILSLKIDGLLYWKLEDLLEVTPESRNMTLEYSKYGFREIKLTRIEKRSVQYYWIQIRLNPIVMIKNEEDISVLCKEDTSLICEEFDHIMKTIIVPGVKIASFSNWNCKRIDYSIDITTSHVAEYINLFNKADRPSSFKKIDKRKGSFYASSKSVSINFYDKQAQLNSKLNGEKTIENTKLIEDANNILRFEIQCKRQKTEDIKKSNEFEDKRINNFLDNNIARDTLLYYYDRTIGVEDFYSLILATRIIEQSNISCVRKQKSINVLKLIA